MPNSCTATIYDGEEVTLRDYLMRVARSCTLAITQRDEHPDNPVRWWKTRVRYRDEQIEKAEATLREVAALSAVEANRRAAAEHRAAVAEWEAERERRLALRRRYESMLEQVEAWEPDPLVAYLKEDAVKHLLDSIEFDCGEPDEEMKYHPYPKRLDGAEWVDRQIRRAQEDLEYHCRERYELLERVVERGAHTDAFLRSLPPGGAASSQANRRRQAMSSETVTDEMVEAAARALYERTFEPGKGATPWGKARDLWRNQYRASARTMLEAALSAEGNDA